MTTPQPPPASTLPPETCPFCRAAFDAEYQNRVVSYACETMLGQNGEIRTPICYEREIAALRADKERLESFLATVMHNFDGMARGQLWQEYNLRFPGSYEKCKAAAIDAARKEAK